MERGGFSAVPPEGPGQGWRLLLQRARHSANLVKLSVVDASAECRWRRE